ncbi:probable UDP-sugar transporter protein SLC35A4 [Strongylocentrotus purpuratus]|uniref:UDP-sugar transporter protein SLC35A4 n=1 Tax=Strongylocentrotus purpuratus TaxID=7668 RepID=A0A7M7LLM8_STRPU|nr:probable UDP-sugar transporter protein SLC35A4 [Strongylocentrotus purpuratus]|eukprot:XP_003730167.1 PREDICTED: probable UDP-sugar transporter protein SLC35A4 [Strongylocentrotus purpuratus]
MKFLLKVSYNQLDSTDSLPKFSSYAKAHGWKLLVLCSVLIYGSHSVLLNLCKDETGVIPFNSAAVVLLTELTKLMLSLALLIPELLAQRRAGIRESDRMLPVRDSWVFALPALFYAVNNNLVVCIQHYMDPASFEVLSKIKIAITAILYRVVLKNQLSTKQWLAIAVLFIGSMCNSFGAIASRQSLRASPSEVYITLSGLLMLLAYCTISGMAGIYTEYILKKQKQVSLSQQNAYIYMYGIAFNFIGYIMTTSSDQNVGFFHGFNQWTLVVILTQAVNGLIQAFLMKHGNSIIRLFIIATAMLVATVLSVLVFSLQLNSFFYTAFISMAFALWLYHG